MRWHDLFSALALLLVLEGILPFLNPRAAKKAYDMIGRLDERSLRMTGLTSMVIGVLVLHLVNWLA